jgi:cytoskeletal protein CcmA (bactofilin family)
MKRFLTFSTVAFTLLTSSSIAFAAGNNETSVTNVGNDRYVGGGTVSVNQPVTGDLTVAGGTVTVNAPVKGSVLAAGGTVLLENTVDGNVRTAGGTVEISKSIKGNLVVAGGTIRIQTGAIIGGSVLIMAGTVTMDGTVYGTITTKGGDLTLNGLVRGDADLHSKTVTLHNKILGNAVIAAQSITTGPSASISKNLRYWDVSGQRDFSKVVKGTATFDSALAIHERSKRDAAGFAAAMLAAFTVYSLLSAALIIGLLLFATKTFFRDSAKYLRTHPGLSLLNGFLYFILTPIAVVILLITVIGIPVALALGCLYFVSLFFAKILTAMVLARWTELNYKKKWTNVVIFFVSLGFFIVLKFIGMVPVLGWIISALAVCMGYGALLRAKYDKYKKIM